jgi:phosphonate transport system ATP-binding protein
MRIHLQGAGLHYQTSEETAPNALSEITLQVQTGEQIALIGPSGAGKTSLLQLLACAFAPSSGSIALDAQNPWALSARALQRLRAQLFLAPQVPPLPPRLRVVTAVLAGRLPQMGFWSSLRMLVWPNDIAPAYAALERFDVAEKLFERVDRLSVGERQRVALARALVSPARLWLVDEPLAALDPSRARQALQSLCDEARTRGVTLIVCLHQVELAREFFPRLLGLREGRVVLDTPPTQLDSAQLEALYVGAADHREP